MNKSTTNYVYRKFGQKDFSIKRENSIITINSAFFLVSYKQYCLYMGLPSFLYPRAKPKYVFYLTMYSL